MRTVLVANRGEIARRIFRSCRARGLSTVAVFSDADADLPHVRQADVAVRIGPPAPSASYLSFEAILGAARRSGADAIHPGYGFLSENADFAQAVVDAGLIWIGPPAAAIRALGDKAAAKALARTCGVPVTPGHAGPRDPAALAAAAKEIGFPLLIKATAGGGGRGMRRVDRAADLAEAAEAASREAASAFGSPEILLERYVPLARHIEVQLLADAHGNLVHLHERECSIQRRHQKIIEEAPSSAVSPELRSKLGESAKALARAAGYVGAGTAEFLLEPDGSYWFLEVNTRLQVEHPVTEAITGLDLVDLQLRIAAGERLPFAQVDVPLRGHAIEARLVAEDPLRDYLPTHGRLLALDVPAGEGLRLDAGYEAGSELGIHYDGLVAKLIAWGEDRAAATRRLRRCVERAWMPGVTSNLPLLRQILAHPAWEAGDLDTGFLARTGLPAAPPLHLRAGAIAATALGWILRRDRQVPAGWRMGGSALQRDTWRCGPESVEVAWRSSADGLHVHAGGSQAEVRVHGWDGSALDLEIDGVRRHFRAVVSPDPTALADGSTVYLHLGDGEAFVRLEPRFPAPDVEEEPGTCVAQTPGTVTKVHVSVGDTVERGQKLVSLEAMKMEQTAVAPHAGSVALVAVAVGQAVREGAILVKVDPA
jgi:3-methylcrotonyl-CoA carboxylase alpha subunit